jgi:hypothetical protein
MNNKALKSTIQVAAFAILLLLNAQIFAFAEADPCIVFKGANQAQSPISLPIADQEKEQLSIRTNLPLEVAGAIIVLLAALTGVLLGLWAYLRKKRTRN